MKHSDNIIIQGEYAYAHRNGDRKISGMQRYAYGWGGWRGSVESNGVECRLKDGHKPNINAVFHAEKLQQFRIAGTFLTWQRLDPMCFREMIYWRGHVWIRLYLLLNRMETKR